MRKQLLLLTIGVLSITTFAQSTPLRVAFLVAPSYSWFARHAGIQGSVSVVAAVNREGKVLKATVTAGSPVLAELAQQALNRWVFEGCDSESCEAPVEFVFALEGVCHPEESGCEAVGFEAELPSRVVVRAARIERLTAH